MNVDYIKEEDFPEGSILIELRDVYDGWSVVRLPNGKLINRWPGEDRRFIPTQNWIDRQEGLQVPQHL